MTRKYIGTKIVTAFAQEKDGTPGYGVIYADGYQSWSPAAAFEEAYRPTEGMPFGLAIEALKKGACVARAGWDGKGMLLWLNRGSSATPPLDRDAQIGGVSSDLFDLGDTGTVTRLPNINMRAADGSTVTGWLASQTDMLADDWMIVE